jgi:hypothetical protein
MSKKIYFEDPESRLIGPLADEAFIKKKCKEWADNDHTKLLKLCEWYGIEVGPSMFYQLSLELARKLHPEPKKRGRKSKWTMLNKGALVVEVERLVRPNDQTHGVEWACRQLANKEPWASFIEAKDGTLGPDPSEALRQIYFGFCGHAWAEISRKAYLMYEYEGKISDWERSVADYVKNPHTK